MKKSNLITATLAVGFIAILIILSALTVELSSLEDRLVNVENHLNTTQKK